LLLGVVLASSSSNPFTLFSDASFAVDSSEPLLPQTSSSGGTPVLSRNAAVSVRCSGWRDAVLSARRSVALRLWYDRCDQRAGH